MSLTQVGFTDQPFDHLYLLPIGAELPSSTSKSFLNQLNATIKELLHAFPMEDQHRIAKLTQLPVGVFPLAVVGETSSSKQTIPLLRFQNLKSFISLRRDMS